MTTGTEAVLHWLREIFAGYEPEPAAIYRRRNRLPWPVVAKNAAELHEQLVDHGQLVPLPTDHAAFAGILETSIAYHLFETAGALEGVTLTLAPERGYPDIELSDPTVGGRPYAIDLKTARPSPGGEHTQRRITLFPGAGFFRWPELHWPGATHPFADYATHIQIIALYDSSPDDPAQFGRFELLVQEAWRIGSRQCSSSTRDYIGAVTEIEALRAGAGEFASEAEFLDYWRAYPFKTSKTAEQQLRKLRRERDQTA